MVNAQAIDDEMSAAALARLPAIEPVGSLPDGIETFMADVGGQRLYCAVRTPRRVEGPPLLLFNGIGANLELAFPFMKALEHTRTIIFDIPGVGGSPLPALPYRAGTVARWSKALIGLLGFDRVDVSGISWGGGMAQQFARQYPRATRRLVLAATSSGWTMVPGKPAVLSKMASFRRYTDPGYMREIAADIYGGDFRQAREAIAPHIRAMRPASGRGYALQLLAMTGWTSLPWLWRLKMPTLVMAGSDDPLVPLANARLLARAIPDATLHTVDNGHLFMVTRPQESAATVEAFLRA